MRKFKECLSKYKYIILILFFTLSLFVCKVIIKHSDYSAIYIFDKDQISENISNIVRKDTNIKNSTDFINHISNSKEDRLLLAKILINFNTDRSVKIERGYATNEEFINIISIFKNKYPNDFLGLDIIPKHDILDNSLYYDIAILFISSTLTILIITIHRNVSQGIKDLQDSKKELAGSVTTAIDKWKENEKQALDDSMQKTIINLVENTDKQFTDAISKFYNAHEGFIKGIYNNYPHQYSEILDPKNKGFEEIKRGNRGLYISIMPIHVNGYASIALNLLSISKISVKSTTYFDNDSFIEILKNGKIDNWLNKVNEKGKINSFQVKRVHIFNEKNKNKSLGDFVNKINVIKDVKEKYINYYIDSIENYRVFQIHNGKKFFGEYIIFDNQIMIKYDEDFEVLELFVGNNVKSYAEEFENHWNDENIYYKEEDLIKILCVNKI